jgi:hypothetical protein
MVMFTLSLALLFAASDVPAPQPPAAIPDKPKKICRDVGRTGTRMSKRKCLTADEWALHERGDKAKLDMVDQSYKQTEQASPLSRP